MGSLFLILYKELILLFLFTYDKREHIGLPIENILTWKEIHGE